MWWVKLGRIGLLIVAPAILVLSLLPDVPSATESLGDKIPHLVAYTALGFLLFAARNRTGAWPLLLAVVLCALYGGVIEILQQFTGRTPDLADWAVDWAGALVGALAAAASRRLLLCRRLEDRDA